ncbi:hypothetical protein B0H13DRAFT_1883671 [Mycena leptocephala]|nr:hypothetical protein B0H13DRAFT_1883671 [Mycena leptocephala]
MGSYVSIMNDSPLNPIEVDLYVKYTVDPPAPITGVSLGVVAAQPLANELANVVIDQDSVQTALGLDPGSLGLGSILAASIGLAAIDEGFRYVPRGNVLRSERFLVNLPVYAQVLAVSVNNNSTVILFAGNHDLTTGATPNSDTRALFLENIAGNLDTRVVTPIASSLHACLCFEAYNGLAKGLNEIPPGINPEGRLYRADASPGSTASTAGDVAHLSQFSFGSAGSWNCIEKQICFCPRGVAVKEPCHDSITDGPLIFNGTQDRHQEPTQNLPRRFLNLAPQFSFLPKAQRMLHEPNQISWASPALKPEANLLLSLRVTEVSREHEFSSPRKPHWAPSHSSLNVVASHPAHFCVTSPICADEIPLIYRLTSVAASSTIAGAVNASALATSVGGTVGSIFAATSDTGD